MNIIPLSAFDLSLAALLVFALGGVSALMHLGITRQLFIAALRTTLQLLLIGLILRTVFANVDIIWVSVIALIMVLLASYEIYARQHRRFSGIWGFGIGASSLFISSLCLILFTLILIIGADPWYTPQYAIPLLGMILGNTMNGISLSLDRLTQNVWMQAAQIEQKLLLGETAQQAIIGIKRDCIRSGLIPIMNAMAAAGIITLPGMMTGQILGGSPPTEAVKYQILIMFLIATSTGFGILIAVHIACQHLFDDRHRLRLDKLKQ